MNLLSILASINAALAVVTKISQEIGAIVAGIQAGQGVPATPAPAPAPKLARLLRESGDALHAHAAAVEKAHR